LAHSYNTLLTGELLIAEGGRASTLFGEETKPPECWTDQTDL